MRCRGSTLDANARECTRMHINAHAMHLKYHLFTTMHTAQVRCTIPINLSQKKQGSHFSANFPRGYHWENERIPKLCRVYARKNYKNSYNVLKYQLFTTMHTAQVRCTIPVNLSHLNKQGSHFSANFHIDGVTLIPHYEKIEQMHL